MEVLIRVGGFGQAGAQVDDAVGGAQGVGVGVQPGGVQDHAGGGLGLGEHGLDAGGRQGSAAVLLQGGGGEEAAGVVGGDVLGQVAGGPQDGVVFVDLPARGVPPVPADAGHVPVVVGIQLDEQFGVAAVRQGVRQEPVRGRLTGRGMPGVGLRRARHDGGALGADLGSDCFGVEVEERLGPGRCHERLPLAYRGLLRPAARPLRMICSMRRSCPGRAAAAVSFRACSASSWSKRPAPTSPPRV